MPGRATRQISKKKLFQPLERPMTIKSILTNAAEPSYGMDTGSVEPESPNTFRGLAIVCAWAVVGLVLTGAVIWFGLDVSGSSP